jgi:alpha-glucosidase
MDVIHLLGKDIDVDDPEDLRALSHSPLNDVAVTHDYLREIRHVLEEYEGDRVSVGEVYLLDPERVATYYGHDDELHLSFNFATLFTPWRPGAWLDVIMSSEKALSHVKAWPTWVLSNHDNARVATRLGADERMVRAAMALLLTLRGTPFLYEGEELGLVDAVIPPDRVVDPGGRDGCRSPMPWTRGADHGWSVEPWLPFAEGASEHSVEAQREDEDSMLHLTRRILEVRRSHEALRRGDLEGLHVEGDVLAFERVCPGERLRVMVNFSSTESAPLPSDAGLVLRTSRGADSRVLVPGELAVVALP